MKRFIILLVMLVCGLTSTTLYAENGDDAPEIIVCGGYGYVADANGECVPGPKSYKRGEEVPISVTNTPINLNIVPMQLQMAPVDLSNGESTREETVGENREVLGGTPTTTGATTGNTTGNTAPAAVPSPGGAPGPSAPAEDYVSGVSDRIATLNSQLRQCKAKLKETAQCCENPMSCLTGESGQYSGVMMALQVAAGTATNMASVSGSCGTLGKVSTGMAAINTALAFKCSSKINQCNSACGRVAKEAEQLASTCQTSNCASLTDVEDASDCMVYSNDLNTSREKPGCMAAKRRTLSRSYASALDKIAEDADQCDTYGGKAVEQQAQAVASLYAAKVAGLCKKAATADTAANGSNNAFNVNCSDPTNAANPVCQNQCNRANAANDPVCAQLLGLGTSGFGNGSGNNGALGDSSATGSGSGSIDEFEDKQSLNDPNIAAGKNSANVGTQGGGGIPGGGASSSAGGGEGGSGGAGEGGLNTNIMGGASSRSGYTNPYMRTAPGGGGYSAEAGRGPASDKGKPFNPRDFLPGGKLDPKRKLAGLASATQEIGAVHGNIFTNITNRFLQVCLRDGLFDCETLRKNSRPRN